MDEFFNGNYYLNSQQQEIERKIYKPGMYGVSGEAGTGKTLIAFDLAKKVSKNAKVLFIFAGQLRKNQVEIGKRINNLKIISAKNYSLKDFDKYNLIIVDEAQKLYSDVRSALYNWGRKNYLSKTLVFFYDIKQTLSSKDSGELMANLCNTFEKDKKGQSLILSKKIRSNPAIASFSKNLFDLNKKPSPKKISLTDIINNVNIKFFAKAESAKPWIRNLIMKNYTFLIPAGDRLKQQTSSDQFRYDFPEAIDTHKIIGEECDKVVTYIDNSVKYDKFGKLIKNSNEYYYIDDEFYVDITRAKEKLAIAIVGNADVFKAITEIILNPEKWIENKAIKINGRFQAVLYPVKHTH